MEPVVLVPQDTTDLDYTAHAATSGLGELPATRHRGLMVHSGLAVTPQRVPLGLIHQEVWARPVEESGKSADRKNRPLREKESRKWLTALKTTKRWARTMPFARVVSVGDREADVFDLVRFGVRIRQDLLIRVTQNRCVEAPERWLFQQLRAQLVSGYRTVVTPRRPKQPSREAVLSIRSTPVRLKPPKDRKRQGTIVTVWAVLATEEHPPEGVEPIVWALVTTVPVESLEDAQERIDWYTCRWIIEEYHRVLKTGLRIEDRQLQTAERLKRSLTIDAIVAWRILALVKESRRSASAACTGWLTAQEWQTLWQVTQPNVPLPTEAPSLRGMVRAIAQLGGFAGRKGDGEPGPETVWRGWQRLQDFLLAFQAFSASSPPPVTSG